jgi:ABC-2 type transport system ATP-binding protein
VTGIIGLIQRVTNSFSHVGRQAVTVDDIVVDRGGRRALDGVSLTVPAGTVTGLLGPSGSGKTTLMRAIVGVQRVSRGQVTVLGRPAGSPALRRLVGYVTQAPSVYGDLTVGANARYFATVYGADETASEAAISDVGLADRANQHADKLSGGELARLSLACALVAAPLLLVLDEPTVGLDPVLRADLWAQFHRLASSGITLLVSSHVMDEADRCDRLLLMRDGRLLADDTPHGLRASTVADDLEGAFLHLIRTQQRVA